MNNRQTMQEQELLDMLKDYPVPEAEAGFYDRALVRAVHKGSRRQRNRWLLRASVQQSRPGSRSGQLRRC